MNPIPNTNTHTNTYTHKHTQKLTDDDLDRPRVIRRLSLRLEERFELALLEICASPHDKKRSDHGGTG